MMSIQAVFTYVVSIHLGSIDFMMFIITVQCKLAGFLAMEDRQTACAQNIAKQYRE